MIQLRSLCSIARSEFNKTLKVRAGILCLVLVGPLGGVLGCAGQKEFQQTARVTLYQISEYENQVNQKAAAENAYAKTMVEILQASARREAYNSEQVLVNGRRNAFAAHVIQDGGKTQGAEITDFANGLITAVADNRKASDSLVLLCQS